MFVPGAFIGSGPIRPTSGTRIARVSGDAGNGNSGPPAGRHPGFGSWFRPLRIVVMADGQSLTHQAMDEF